MINTLKEGAPIPKRCCWVADIGTPIKELVVILDLFLETPLAHDHSTEFTLIPKGKRVELYSSDTITPYYVLGFIFGWEAKEC